MIGFSAKQHIRGFSGLGRRRPSHEMPIRSGIMIWKSRRQMWRIVNTCRLWVEELFEGRGYALDVEL